MRWTTRLLRAAMRATEPPLYSGCPECFAAKGEPFPRGWSGRICPEHRAALLRQIEQLVEQRCREQRAPQQGATSND